MAKKVFRTEELVRLWDSINLLIRLSDANRPDPLQFGSRKFSHALIRNKKRLEELGEAWDHDRKQPEWVAEYNDKMRELRKKHADKTENGEPVTVNGIYQLGKNEGDFVAEVLKLNKEYEIQQKENNQRIKDLQKEWDEGEQEYDPFMVSFENVPECINLRQLEDLDIIISQEEVK